MGFIPFFNPWEPFCRKHAVPLIESLEREEEPEDEDEPLGACVERFFRFAGKHPILLGATLPFAILLFSMPRMFWWATAAMTAISGVVNIRLVWGVWFEPNTEIVFWAGAAFFCLGLVTPVRRWSQKRPNSVGAPAVILGLAVVLIGVPLLCNVIVLGWVWISNGLVVWLLPALLTVGLAVIFLMIVRTRRCEKRQAPSLEADALRRWKTYVEMGKLPEASDKRATKERQKGATKGDKRQKGKRQKGIGPIFDTAALRNGVYPLFHPPFSSVGKLPSIRYLSLEGTNVSGEGLKHLRKLDDLRVLYLEGSAISEADLAEIAQFTNLERLNLSETGVTGDDLSELNGLTQLKKLQLSISPSPIDSRSPRGLRKLRQALPNVQITYDTHWRSSSGK